MSATSARLELPNRSDSESSSDDLTSDFQHERLPTEQSQEQQKTQKLKELTHLLAVQMAPNRLKDAARSDSKEALQEAIVHFNALKKEIHKMYEDTHIDPEIILTRAQNQLKAITNLETKLGDACKSKDPEQILQVMREIRQSRVRRFLRTQLEEAQDKLVAMPVQVERAVSQPILAMDKKTMTELKHYANPSPIVHKVMQATFLLLGVDESKTSAWIRCQAMCNPDGPNGLNRKLMQFNSTRVKPFIARRVRAMLKGIELSRVQRASPGAATFYVWVQGVLGRVEKEEQSEDDDDVGTKITDKELEGKTLQSLTKIIQQEQDIFKKQRNV